MKKITINDGKDEQDHAHCVQYIKVYGNGDIIDNIANI